MRMLLMFVAALFSFGVVHKVLANIPEFDGVYAQLKDGSFVQLLQIEPTPIILAGRGDDIEITESRFFSNVVMTPFGVNVVDPIPDFMICLWANGFNIDQTTSQQEIDLRNVDAIVVRSPQAYKINGIAHLTKFDAVQSSLQERQGSRALPNPVDIDPFAALNPRTQHFQNCHGRPGEHLNSRTGRPELVLHNWGWWSWRTQTVDSLVTRFVPEQQMSPPVMAPDFLGELGKWPIEGFALVLDVGGSRQFFFIGNQIKRTESAGRRVWGSSGRIEKLLGQDKVTCHNPTQSITWEVSGGKCPAGFYLVE